MATHHAAPGEIVNLENWANDLPHEQSKVITKTEEMELARLFLPAGEAIENHHVDGPLVIHCLTGELEVSALGEERDLNGGELLYLPPAEPFTLKARAEARVLLTFIFSDNKKL